MYNKCRICGETGKATILPVLYYVTLCEDHLNAFSEYVLEQPESLDMAIARQDKDLKTEFRLRIWWYHASKIWVKEKELEFREQRLKEKESNAD